MENQVQNQAQDIKTLHFEKDHELKHWSKKFGISIDELLKAVQTGGTSTDAIEKYVKRLEYTH